MMSQKLWSDWNASFESGIATLPNLTENHLHVIDEFSKVKPLSSLFVI